MIPCIPFHRDTRIFCVVEEYLPLGMFHTAILMLGFGHYETMAVHFFFFLLRNSTFIQATARIQLKSLNQVTSIGGGRFLGKKITVLLN
jgi:hypothetical protein